MMAKYECTLTGSFYDLLETIDNHILSNSMSASFEDGSDYICGDIKCAVRVYERYSAFGGNRVSLNVTAIDNGRDIFVSAITSGGSQAMLFKINTLGEETFLDCLMEAVQKYQRA